MQTKNLAYKPTLSCHMIRCVIIWEVPNGVGVDGVGGNFPLFVFIVSLFSLFVAFFSFSKDTEKQLQFTGKMGNFTLTPSAPTLFKTSRII